MTRWWRLIHRARLERDLDRELRDHLERQVTDFMRDGMSEVEARRKAALSFGGIDTSRSDIYTAEVSKVKVWEGRR